MKQLTEMTVKELKDMARDMKISNWWNYKKEVLIRKITEKNEENAAIAQYEKNWRKYTERFNVDEFLEKWKAGEITFEVEVEESVTEEHEVVEEPEVVEAAAEAVEAPAKPKRGQLIEYNGKAQNICAWGKELGISANTLYNRLYKQGWSIEKAFTKKK